MDDSTTELTKEEMEKTDSNFMSPLENRLNTIRQQDYIPPMKKSWHGLKALEQVMNYLHQRATPKRYLLSRSVF